MKKKSTTKRKKQEIDYTIMHENIKDLDVYFHTFCEDCKPFLSHNPSEEELLQIYHSIHKCPKCGGDIELHEYDCMGDGYYTINCKRCGRMIERNQYDCDITKWEDVLEFCIRDWNDGLTRTDIEKKNEAERGRILLTPDDFCWFPYYPNNMPVNGKEGYIALLFRKNSDGTVYCLKWTILYQFKEIRGLTIREIESYNLFMQRYFDLEAPFHYPEPSNADFNMQDIGLGVNDRGDFVRNYKTLRQAKQGALTRSGFYGFNKDTLLNE